GYGIADSEAEPCRALGIEGHQEPPGIVRCPPLPLHQLRALWRRGCPGDAAVALKHPFDVRGHLDLVNRYVLDANDPPPEHRHFIVTGGVGPAGDEALELLALLRLHIDEVEGRGRCRKGTLDLAPQA